MSYFRVGVGGQGVAGTRGGGTSRSAMRDVASTARLCSGLDRIGWVCAVPERADVLSIPGAGTLTNVCCVLLARTGSGATGLGTSMRELWAVGMAVHDCWISAAVTGLGWE